MGNLKTCITVVCLATGVIPGPMLTGLHPCSKKLPQLIRSIRRLSFRHFSTQIFAHRTCFYSKLVWGDNPLQGTLDLGSKKAAFLYLIYIKQRRSLRPLGLRFSASASHLNTTSAPKRKKRDSFRVIWSGKANLLLGSQIPNFITGSMEKD